MRWRLTSAVTAFLVLVLAASANAKNPDVTVTLEPTDGGGHPVSAVQFPGIGTGEWFPQHPTDRIQHYVGEITYPTVNGRYEVDANIRVGGADRPIHFSFDAQDSCSQVPAPDPANEGQVVRIACATPINGVGLQCNAIYSGAADPPQPTCTGTVACKNCGNIKVCGSKPNCY
jgi:hypothetical protein